MDHPVRGSAEGSDPFKALFRKLERAIAHIEQLGSTAQFLEAILEHLCTEFQDELGFEGGRIYDRNGEDYELCCGFGTSRDVPAGLKVPRDYPPHQKLLTDGIVLMARGDPGVDEQFEESIGVGSTFAAIGVGEGVRHIIAFSLKKGVPEEVVFFSLALVRHVVNLRLQERRIAGILDAARIVHEGLLPAAAPAFGGFDIAASTRPAETVSGDVFDYLPISDRCLGLAIADSSGHGLPAALLARDVVTALRTLAGNGLGVAATVERVNAVIRHAAVSGTFVSLFYGQLLDDGRLEYCNAGHDRPFLIRGSTVGRLEVAGAVLGPFPAVRHESRVVELVPGDLLVLHTDGIVERQDRSGEFYGAGRLGALLVTLRDRGAQEVIAAVMRDVDAFAGGLPAKDDMTLVVVRRRPSEPC